MTDKATKEKIKSSANWIIYVSLLLSGIILLAKAFQYTHLDKWTAKIGIALLYSAIALFIGNGRKSGYLGTVIIWAIVIVSYFI